MEWNRCC